MKENSQDTFRREDFDMYLNNVIASARSVTWVLKKDFKHKEGFKEWYSGKQEEMGARFKSMVGRRNNIVKEGKSVTPGLSTGTTFSHHPFVERDLKVIGTLNDKDGNPKSIMWGREGYNDYFGKSGDESTNIVPVLTEYLDYLTNLVNEAVKKFG